MWEKTKNRLYWLRLSWVIIFKWYFKTYSSAINRLRINVKINNQGRYIYSFSDDLLHFTQRFSISSKGNPVVEFRKQLEKYKGIDKELLRENLYYFLQQVIPVAEEQGIMLCIHPDDPPFPVFGLAYNIQTMCIFYSFLWAFCHNRFAKKDEIAGKAF